MDIIERALSSLAGGRVLDVATQEGRFVQILMDNLHSYTQIVGIDVNEQAIKTAHDTIGQDKVQFLVVNAEQLVFAAGSFDTVSISASLHHFANIRQVLAETERVLKPGGNFVLAEMYREAQTEAELTSVYLHQWAAQVDCALGRLHNRTLARQELIDHVASLGLSQVELSDYTDRDSDPMEKTTIEQLDGLIERIIQRAEPAAPNEELKRQGEALRQRLHQVGARREPVLVVIGKK
jgi:ubiquinone/menaquinone biosynthesis C-methylase UbiE